MEPTIKEVQVKVFQRRLICECGGEMEWTGRSKPMNPPYYIHKCSKCGEMHDVSKGRYPRIRYEEIKDSDT